MNLSDLRYRVRALIRRNAVEAELERELQVHLAGLVQRHLDAGCPRDEAERRARVEFGGVEQIKEVCRDERGVGVIESGWRDLRHAARLLRADWSFAVIACLTLALGIGATTAAFSVVHVLLLKPLPYPDAERIVFPWLDVQPGIDIGFNESPWGRWMFNTFARQTRTFAHLGAFVSGQFNLTGAGDPARLEGLSVSAGFLPSLGIAPALGRAFTPEEDQPGHEPVVILSDGLWRDRFQADRGIVGRTLLLNGLAHTVVGVMPPKVRFPRDVAMPGSFAFPREATLWVPLALEQGPHVYGEPFELAVVGRLAPGVTLPQAQAELDTFSTELHRQMPRGTFTMHLRTLPRQATGDTERPAWLFFAAVALVLLIACANVASLLLTKAIGRSREFRLRVAIGASRAQLVRQLLTESLLLAVIGGAAGTLIAWGTVTMVRTVGPVAALPQLADLRVDLPMLLFAFVVSLATGLLFGLAPAMGATGEELALSAREGRGGTARGVRLHQALLVGEVALALILVAASGLLVQTFVHLSRVGGGFDADRVLTFELTLPPAKYVETERMVALYHTVLERLGRLPGVRAAGISETLPMGGAGESTGVRIPGRARDGDQAPPFANYTIASPGYFEAVGTPILQGRGFLPSDTARSQPVAIVSAAMAKRYWPGQDVVVGRTVSLPIYKFDMLIVGVAADVKHQSFREVPGPEMYVPLTQKPWPSMATMHVSVRTTSMDPTAMTASLREAVRAVDPDLPIANVATLESIAAEAMVQSRFAMLTLTTFGALALTLACVGLYGVMSRSVVRRTQEIGVRLALGAPRRRVLTMVLSDGARVTACGILIGVVGSLAGLRVMSRFLYGITATDPATFGVVMVVLFVVALLACYVPARRATRVDPMTALRGE